MAANLAAEGLLARVRADVRDEVALLAEAAIAQLALVGPLVWGGGSSGRQQSERQASERQESERQESERQKEKKEKKERPMVIGG